MGCRLTLAIVLATLAGQAVAEAPAPFEGTWVRADRVCLPSAPSARTYTARSLVGPGGRCTIRKVAFGAGEYEIFEDCHRAERSGYVVEKIRMLGPDALVLKFQTSRLKIPRGRRFLRCTVAAPKAPALAPGRPPVVLQSPRAGVAPATPGAHEPE